MGKLEEVLLDPKRRDAVVDDCVSLVESEVSGKTGLTGMAVKGAFAVVKKVKPGIIREAVDHLLNEFVERLDPFHAEFATAGAPAFSTYLASRSSEVADALLGVTDKRVANAKNATIRKAYEKLRPSGAKHVEAAVPGIGRVISKYV